MGRSPIVGVVGFQNAGKTTLVERLVVELVGRGLVVRTIKHAHHTVDLDVEGKDSYRHRAAGASSVAVVSAGRWAVLHEGRGAPPPSVEEVARALGPADLILVEGWKLADHPKIEVRAPGSAAPRLWATDPRVFAVASPDPQPGCCVPVLDRGAIQELADLSLASAGGG